MAFQLQGGNPASNDYDYQSGSAMDSFMSRAIDEVSWQANLGSTYVSLSTLPIGLSPTSATATNFDSTQISGSQSGTSTIGGSNGSGSSAGLAIDATNNVITLGDGTNDRLILGQSQNGF